MLFLDKYGLLDAFEAGIGYISKDRDKETLITAATIKDNLCLSASELLNVFGVIPSVRESEFTQEQIEGLKINMRFVGNDRIDVIHLSARA